MKKFTKEMKDRWVAALRSGDYKQGSSCLHDSEDGTYCCLGVLQDLENLDGLIAWDIFDTLEMLAPIPGLGREIQEALVKLNDGDRESFWQIANYIEEHVPAVDEDA